VTCVRARYNALPWPAWSIALAPDSTLFLPLTHRSRSIYDTVPGDDGDERNANPPVPIPVLPPNYNSLATSPRWRPPTPGALGPLVRGQEGDLSENSQGHEEEEEGKEEGPESGEFVRRTRHAFDSLFVRLHQVLDESDSDAESTMTPMLRSVDRPEAIVREERKEEVVASSPSRDIEMGPPQTTPGRSHV
jgi:hypothetical protein